MGKSCLLVIDMQNDFCTGSLAIDGALEIIEPINFLMRKLNLVIACQDWHPVNHQSFASQHKKKAGEVVNLMGMEQILWVDHCIQNTKGADFPKNLQTHYFQKIFFKGINPKIDSYSAFYDMANKHSTGLTDWLQEQAIQKIYMVGLATDYCVKFSALDALADGFKVAVIRTFCKAVNLQPEDEQKALWQMQEKGAEIITEYHN